MSGREGGTPQDEAVAQRLDKWLWFARVAKSRTLAASFVTGGKIRVNRERTLKPSHLVKAGDVITSGAQRQVRVLRVKGLGTRRGPPLEARALYEELTPAPAEPKSVGLSRPSAEPPAPDPLPQGARPHGAGRPTKRDRRQIDHLKGREI